jgi:hypothetical protein
MSRFDDHLQRIHGYAQIIEALGTDIKKSVQEQSMSVGNELARLNATVFQVIVNCRAIIVGTTSETLAKNAIVLEADAQRIKNSFGGIVLDETLFENIDEFLRTLNSLFPMSASTT